MGQVLPNPHRPRAWALAPYATQLSPGTRAEPGTAPAVLQAAAPCGTSWGRRGLERERGARSPLLVAVVKHRHKMLISEGLRGLETTSTSIKDIVSILKNSRSLIHKMVHINTRPSKRKYPLR